MSYEEQLSAARFMAERDLARQELDRMRPALEWVEEHGGLEKIRRQRRDSVPRAAYERKRGKLLKHIAECETALGKRKKRIEELEAEAEGLRERINRPAPVLAADGEPLREKIIVFDKDTGEKLGVDAVTARDVTCRRLEHGGMVVHYTPEFLTHERPVADTWERIEDDCTMPERDYYAKHIGHDVGLKDDAEIHEAVSRDLVRRAKKPSRTASAHGERRREMSRFEGAPDLIGADGRPIERWDTVHELGKVKPIIVGFIDYVDRSVSGFYANTGARVYNLRPEQLTHEAQPDSIGALAGDLVELAERAKGWVLYREIAALAARALCLDEGAKKLAERGE